MNLPNALTVGRIVITPLIDWLPFTDDWRLRLLAFVLFIAAHGVLDRHVEALCLEVATLLRNVHADEREIGLRFEAGDERDLLDGEWRRRRRCAL